MPPVIHGKYLDHAKSETEKKSSEVSSDTQPSKWWKTTLTDLWSFVEQIFPRFWLPHVFFLCPLLWGTGFPSYSSQIRTPIRHIMTQPGCSARSKGASSFRNLQQTIGLGRDRSDRARARVTWRLGQKDVAHVCLLRGRWQGFLWEKQQFLIFFRRKHQQTWGLNLVFGL